MQSLQQEYLDVKQEPDGVFVWMHVAMERGSIFTSRTCFRTFDEAADAALRQADSLGLPLAADVSIFIEMASPWYAGREMEEVAI
jgi:hypothetical protein